MSQKEEEQKEELYVKKKWAYFNGKEDKNNDESVTKHKKVNT